MVLAAGRGQRLRPLTDHMPKPLLPVRGRPLLIWHLHALARGGVRRVLINTAWLGAQIPAALGAVQDTPWGEVALAYSMEGEDFGHALETAGGIARALPRLEDPFWLVAGDVYAPDFAFDEARRAAFARRADLAHLWLVPNPPHHPAGDFGLDEGHALDLPADDPRPRWTYSTIALLRHALFRPPWCDIPPGNPNGAVAPLAPVLRRAMAAGRVSAEVWPGAWTDVGTPQRLAALQAPAT
ncbi:UTP--glucose-1-phosphate uridylyltransferase [Tepidimonas alkaliphilus]|uniref:UTP--glucose-1-phosphate uridylyltransferase n=1 Tax=Tepidimonas alkaliphilus TaxID=2588942 RepID=A0A554WBS4_9BURK|nr:nucleotidyltransferase family protein [Tepidimonas alkaliphilus]TSE21030.1 UTP--glucose-1-phosphate uridylyltransferase [Tepidimonas alkaliphilus]